MNRRIAFSGAVLAARMAMGSKKRRASFETTELELPLPIDPVHDGLKVAQLSDLHLGLATPAERVRSAIDAINAAQVDLVALTGDFVTYSQKPMPLISQLLQGFTAPVFAVLGNHDHWIDAGGVVRQLTRAGAEVLRNQHTKVWLRGAPLTVVGVDDGLTGNDDVEAAFRGVEVGAGGTTLVLAHTPPTAQRLPENAGLLCLSGHTHGGQLVVPKVTDAILRRSGQPYVRGLYKVRGNRLYVNRGLGYGPGGPAIRLGARPELTIFTMRCVAPTGQTNSPSSTA